MALFVQKKNNFISCKDFYNWSLDFGLPGVKLDDTNVIAQSGRFG